VDFYWLLVYLHARREVIMLAEQQPLADGVGDDMRGEAYGLKQATTKGDFTDGSHAFV
jgi:hypothetical protein